MLPEAVFLVSIFDAGFGEHILSGYDPIGSVNPALAGTRIPGSESLISVKKKLMFLNLSCTCIQDRYSHNLSPILPDKHIFV